MPLYIPLGARFESDASVRERLERQRMAHRTNILRHGTAEQRRQVLKMKPLPLPEDPEAVAVPGTAVLDLPGGADASLGARNGTDVLGPLALLSRRYDGVHHDDDGKHVATPSTDYSTFMEVLCPNGLSLLELLPLAPRTTRQHPKGPRCKSHQPQLESTLPSQWCALHPRLTPAAVAATIPAAPLSLGYNTLAAHELPSVSLVNTSTSVATSAQPGLDDTYVDAPVTFVSEATSPLASPEDGSVTPMQSITDPASDIIQATATAHVDDDDTNLGIFVSAGFFSLAAPHCGSPPRSRLSLRRSPFSLSRGLHADSVHHNASSVGSLSSTLSHSHRALKGSSELSLPTSSATSAQLTSLAVVDNCDLGGRVLFTDRFVKAQSHTALPIMISAFKQYMRSTSTTASSSPLTHNQSVEIHTLSEYRSSLPHQQLPNSRQKLHPCQPGIPLKSHSTNTEIENCVLEAGRGIRPTFRRVDPADLYGTSHYVPRDLSSTK
nr:unnamed protein product [Leishmania braziliensis]